MAKIYSLPLIISAFLFSSSLYGQTNGNVAIGHDTPVEKLDVDGAIKIGTTTGNYAGTIRYNLTTNKFEGRDSISWKPFGTGGEDDWTTVGQTPVANDGADIFHSGNVGIGTAIPLAKMHAKGLGGIAVKAETSNDDAAVPAIEAINTIGIAIKATTSSDTLPAVWATSDSSIAIKAETNSEEFPAVYAYQEDSVGYALAVVNKDAEGVMEGGNALLVIGDQNIHGAVRNTSALYGGSVAVNDGLTVGSISGATCLTITPEVANFNRVIIPEFLFFSGTSSTYPNVLDSTYFVGECRSVTNFTLESTFFDFDIFPINMQLFVRNQFIGEVIVPKADLNLTPPLPANPPLVALWDDGGGGWYSTWSHSSDDWNGTDPKDINWFLHVVNSGPDTDCLVEYTGILDYNWGNFTSSPYYAAFGEVRASGTLYANSINEYGDVAEYFKVEKKLRLPEPGDIVSISKENPQSFVLSTSPSEPLLAGVISEDPSLIVNNPNPNQEPIALAGRVKVKVNMEGGKISLGDPITSSSVEGIGMKSPGTGMILGRALESFDGSRADEGKIWILIATTQVMPSPGIKIVQGKDFNLGGVMISGGRTVSKNERSVFIAWDKKANTHMPNDVEFDDLVIDVKPRGGNANLVITAVSKEGFEVSVKSRSKDFEGFYYSAEIVSAEFGLPEENEVVAANQNVTYEERVFNAKDAYARWNAVAEQLMSLSGRSLKDMPAGLSLAEIKEFKESVVKSWKKADGKLYSEYLSLQDQWGSAVAGDMSVMRKMSEE